jgi:hypothetical protein
LPIEPRSIDPHSLFGLVADHCRCCGSVTGATRWLSWAILFYVCLFNFGGYPSFVFHTSSGPIPQANCRFSIYCLLLSHRIISVLWAEPCDLATLPGNNHTRSSVHGFKHKSSRCMSTASSLLLLFVCWLQASLVVTQ